MRDNIIAKGNFFCDLTGPNLNTHQTIIIQLWNEDRGPKVTVSSPI
jgi:hypothetical protein